MIKFKNILKEAFEGMNSVVSIGGPIQMKEAAPKMKKSKEEENIKKVYLACSGLKKGGSSGRYGKEFDKAKKKAMQALNDMLTYAKIGV